MAFYYQWAYRRRNYWASRKTSESYRPLAVGPSLSNFNDFGLDRCRVLLRLANFSNYSEDFSKTKATPYYHLNAFSNF